MRVEKLNHQPIDCALIGYGRWGRILADRLVDHLDFQLRAICDLKVHTLKERSDVHCTTSISDILDNPEIDTVFVAVPPEQHFIVASSALLHNKHVWLEKPCCTSQEELAELIEMAQLHQRALHLNFITIYNPLFQDLKAWFIEHCQSDHTHLTSYRVNHLYPEIQRVDQIDLVYDLGIHDLCMIKKLIPSLEVDQVAFSLFALDNGEEIEINENRLCSLRVEHPKVTANLYMGWWMKGKKREFIVHRPQHKDTSLYLAHDPEIGAIEVLEIDECGRQVIHLNGERIDALHNSLEALKIQRRDLRYEEAWDLGIFLHRLIDQLKGIGIQSLIDERLRAQSSRKSSPARQGRGVT